MIDAALLHIAGHLNAVLRRSHQSPEDLVAVTGLSEADGSPAASASHRLSAFLVNLERDAVPGQPAHLIGSGERMARSAPPVHLNLLLMFAANYGGTTYPEALKLIASTIACFQATPVLDAQNSPGLDPRLDKLTLAANISIGQEAFDNVNIGTEDSDAWLAWALYGKFVFGEGDRWGVALRIDGFSNDEGSRLGTAPNVEQTLLSVTATLEHRPISALILRLEVRLDTSDEEIYDDSDGAAEDSQMTFGFEAIFVY